MHLLFQLSTRSWLTAGLSVLCSGSDLPRALCWCLVLPVLVVNWVSCAPKLGISLSIPAGSKEGSLGWLQSFKGRFEAAFPVGVEQGLGVPGATRAGHLVRGQKALVKANSSWKSPAICPEAGKGLSLWH